MGEKTRLNIYVWFFGPVSTYRASKQKTEDTSDSRQATGVSG
jgi:hypothetical protein